MFPPDDSSLSKSSAFWRAIGRLEGTVEVLLENQRQLSQRQLRVDVEAGDREAKTERQFSQQEPQPETQLNDQESRAETEALVSRAIRRLDQCFYVVLIGGGALAVLIFAIG